MADKDRDNEPKETDALLGGERDESKTLEDHELQDRLGFIRKVYFILSCQLSFSFGAIAVTKSVDAINDWMRH